MDFLKNVSSNQCLERTIWKGMLKVLLAVVHGLEFSATSNINNNSSNSANSSKKANKGLASAFGALEIAHTHYWTKEVLADDKEAAVAADNSCHNQLMPSYSGPSALGSNSGANGKQRPTSITSTVRFLRPICTWC